MPRRLIVALAILALLAAACGADQAAPTTAGATATTSAPDEGPSCDALLSPDDVAALFGEPAGFDAETSEETEDTLNCVWQSVPASVDEQRQVFQIQVYQGEDYYVAELLEDAEPIEGIGDEAYFSPELGVSVGFREGDEVVMITYSVLGSGEVLDPLTRKDQVIALLRLVHDRLV